MRLKTTNRRAAQRGFTLTEMLMTVTLAAVLIGLGVPAFKNSSARSRLMTQANDFVSAMSLARSDSITRNISVTFCRAEGETADECVDDEGAWTAWIVVDANGDVLRRGEVNEYGGAIKVSSDLDIDAITFTPDGLSRTGGALSNDREITVCTTSSINENFRHVTLGAGSRVAVTRDNGTCT